MKNLLLASILLLVVSSGSFAANSSCKNSTFIKVTVINSAEDSQHNNQVFFASIAEKFGPKAAFNKKAESKKLDVYRYRLDESIKPVKFSTFEYIGEAAIVSERNILITADKSKSSLVAEESSFVNSSPEKRYALLFLEKKTQEKELALTNSNVAIADKSLKKILSFVAFPEATGLTKDPAGLTVTCTCKGYFGGTSCCTSPTCNVVLGTCQDNSSCKQNGSCSEYTSCNCAK